MTTVTTYAVVAEKENAKPVVIDLFATREEALLGGFDNNG